MLVLESTYGDRLHADRSDTSHPLRERQHELIEALPNSSLDVWYEDGVTAATLGLTGEEVFDVNGLAQAAEGRREVHVTARRADGKTIEFDAILRLDTPQEVLYYQHGGILSYVLRQLRG